MATGWDARNRVAPAPGPGVAGLIVLLTVAIVATSCSRGDERPAIGQILQNPTPAEITLPLDAYTLSLSDHMAFMNASVEEFSAEGYARSEQDARVQDAFDGWSDCMAAAGFQYGDPWEANDDPQWYPSEDQTSGTARVTDLQIATATADVQCKQDVNLAGIWLAVETAYQLELIADNEERLGQIKRHRDEVLRAAAEVE